MCGIDGDWILGNEVVASAHEIIGQQASGDIGIEDDDGDDVAVGNEGFSETMNGAALMAIAGNLRDFENGKLRFRVLVRVFQQCVSELFGSCDSGVREDSSAEFMREIHV